MDIKEEKNDYCITPIKFSCDDMIPVKLPLLGNSFFTIIIGKPSSGKTTLLINMIVNRDMYRKQFDKLYVFGKIATSSEIKNPFDKLPDNQKHVVLDDDTLGSVYDEIHNSENRCLLIFDDVQNEIRGNTQTLLTKIVYNRRHIPGGKGFICIILTSQVYNRIPLCIRKVADSIYFYQSKNTKEIKSLCEEYLSVFTENEIKHIFEYVYCNEHDFLVVLPNKRKKDMLYKNFNKLIFET